MIWVIINQLKVEHLSEPQLKERGESVDASELMLPQLWIARCQGVSGTCFHHKPPHRTANKRPCINTDRRGNLQSHFWSADGVFSASQNLRNRSVHLTNEETVAQGWGMPCWRPCTGDFPAGPAVTTLHFHCWGCRYDPLGN